MPSPTEYVVVIAIGVFGLWLLVTAARMWILRPLPDGVVCGPQFGRSAAGMIGAIVAMAASVPVALLVTPWLGMAAVVASILLVAYSQRLYWQTKWAHDDGRCGCPTEGETP